MRLAGMFLLIASSCLAVQAERVCQETAGGIVTNFIDSADTLGSATGDLAGGLGVHVLAQQAGQGGTTLITVQHHWVTQAGDTLGLNHAVVTLFPTSVSGFYAANYLDGVEINKNGTGRFAGASGKIYGWGAVDMNTGALVLRYSGKVCREE